MFYYYSADHYLPEKVLTVILLPNIPARKVLTVILLPNIPVRKGSYCYFAPQYTCQKSLTVFCSPIYLSEKFLLLFCCPIPFSNGSFCYSDVQYPWVKVLTAIMFPNTCAVTVFIVILLLNCEGPYCYYAADSVGNEQQKILNKTLNFNFPSVYTVLINGRFYQ